MSLTRKVATLVTKNFDPSHNITVDCNIQVSHVQNHQAVTLHILWTKTTWFNSADCCLTQRNDLFCPVCALTNHLLINHPSDGFSLFTFYDSSDNRLSLTFLTNFSQLQIVTLIHIHCTLLTTIPQKFTQQQTLRLCMDTAIILVVQ